MKLYYFNKDENIHKIKVLKGRTTVKLSLNKIVSKICFKPAKLQDTVYGHTYIFKTIIEKLCLKHCTKLS